MSTQHRTWAIVLAAGEGTRLRSLTTDANGRPTPKQYCSLVGGSTLLQDALRRGHAVSGRARLCAIVAAHHADWWRRTPWALPRENVIAQPIGRGTANGILLSLLSVLARDPLARVLLLPADHYVEDEVRLGSAIGAAVSRLERAPGQLLLVGIEPDEADPELGYIVPGSEDGGVRRVVRFVEKPPAEEAAELFGGGALWNSFIFAARGSSLLRLFRDRLPEVVDAMETAVARGAPEALRELYAALPEIDFSRHILQGAEADLRVVASQACGWTDLGTPRRVGEALSRIGLRQLAMAKRPKSRRELPVNLAAAYLRPRLAM
jgi:mannose-1-phosphate guanylyltransferase